MQDAYRTGPGCRERSNIFCNPELICACSVVDNLHSTAHARCLPTITVEDAACSAAWPLPPSRRGEHTTTFSVTFAIARRVKGTMGAATLRRHLTLMGGRIDTHRDATSCEPVRSHEKPCSLKICIRRRPRRRTLRRPRRRTHRRRLRDRRPYRRPRRRTPRRRLRDRRRLFDRRPPRRRPRY